MKTFILILILCVSILYLAMLKPKPSIIELQKTPSTQNCLAPNTNNHQHKGCCNTKGKAYYIIEQAKRN